MMRDRLIIYRLGSLGDSIVALPCFHKIAASFPDHERIALTNIPVASNAAPLESILNQANLIDGVIEYPVGARSPKVLWDLSRKIAASRAKTLIYLAPSRGLGAIVRDVAFFRACGIRQVIGAPYDRDLRTNRSSPSGSAVEAEARRLARTIAALGTIDVDDARNWDLRLTEVERAKAAKILAPVANIGAIAINMGGKVRRNDWGAERWTQLLADLSADFGRRALVVIGADADHDRAGSVTDRWLGPVINLCGALNPRESAAVLSNMSLFIGHDSGPLHLASAAGCPTVGLFSTNNPPGKWYPIIGDVSVVQCRQSMDDITVDEVASMVRRSLSRPNSDRIKPLFHSIEK